MKNGDVNSDGYAEGFGQVWAYRPDHRGNGDLWLVYESPSGAVLDSPDNITVTPRGGLVMCRGRCVVARSSTRTRSRPASRTSTGSSGYRSRRRVRARGQRAQLDGAGRRLLQPQRQDDVRQPVRARTLRRGPDRGHDVRDHRAVAEGTLVARSVVAQSGIVPDCRRRKGECMSDDRRVLTNRQGHPVYDNQNQRTVGDARPGHARELPVPREDQPLRPRAHPRARRPRARHDAPTATSRRTARSATSRSRKYTRAKLFQEAGKRTDARRPLLDRHRRPRLVRGRARPARLRGEVLHRGRQLGPRRQQPRGLLHPRRDQVPGRHPLPEARPGDVQAPGPEPHLRLHQPDARGACT